DERVPAAARREGPVDLRTIRRRQTVSLIGRRWRFSRPSRLREDHGGTIRHEAQVSDLQDLDLRPSSGQELSEPLDPPQRASSVWVAVAALVVAAAVAAYVAFVWRQ